MKLHNGLLFLLVLTGPTLPVLEAQDKTASTKITWKKTVVDRTFRSEGVAIADVNKDGKMDIIVGDVWYEAPDWKMHALRKERIKDHKWDPKGYSECFGVFAGDFNGDGYPDVMVMPHPGRTCFWYENPKGKNELWVEHILTNSACNETPIFVDLFKTGKKVPVFGWRPTGKGGGEVCYFVPGKDPTQPWERHSISGPSKDGKDVPGSFHYYHGLGCGDVNGDGRNDILVPEGWWEQPEKVDGQPWKWHPARIGPACADMHTLDVDGDGKPDVISSSAHGYGLWWHQQKPGDVFLTHDFFLPPPALTKEPVGIKFSKEEQALYQAINKMREGQKRAPWQADGKLCELARQGKAGPEVLTQNVNLALQGDSQENVLQQLGKTFADNANYPLGAPPNFKVGVGVANGKFVILLSKKGAFSLPGQTHALHMVDINGDGQKDLVTGRRWWAHGPGGDVSPADPPYIYWFECRKGSDGTITFIPHVVDDGSGIGTQFEVADINGDGLPDIIVSNKKGVFVFEQVRSAVVAPQGNKE